MFETVERIKKELTKIEEKESRKFLETEIGGFDESAFYTQKRSNGSTTITGVKILKLKAKNEKNRNTFTTSDGKLRVLMITYKAGHLPNK